MDEIYYLMCLKSFQLQALKGNIGWFDQHDLIYNKNTGIILLAIQLLKNETSDQVFWIPRQDQIQTLILKRSRIDQMIESFDDWVFSAGFNFIEQKLTLEKLWLIYYMEVFFEMYWCFPCNAWKMLKYKELSSIK